MSSVSIVRCQKYDPDDIYKAIKRALKDIDFKMPKGKKVLLKPNVLGSYAPDACVTTHPTFIEAMCRILKENKCKVVVGDSSGFAGSTKAALCASGISRAAEKHGAEVIAFESTKLIQKRIKGKILNTLTLPSMIDEVDMVISLPKLKTHTLMTYTAGIKNLFGFIPGGRKPDYHNLARDPKKFAELLCDIYETVKPKVKLTILDAIVGMEGNGPASGKKKQTGLVIVSDDAGALDFAVQKIIKLQSPTMDCLIERKLLDPDKVKIASEIPNIPYKAPTSFLSLSGAPPWIQRLVEKQMVAHPHVKTSMCVKCGICAKSCPVKAITLNPYPVFNRKTCMDCYCCHELCPVHAICLKGTLGRKILVWVMNLKAKARNL